MPVSLVDVGTSEVPHSAGIEYGCFHSTIVHDTPIVCQPYYVLLCPGSRQVIKDELDTTLPSESHTLMGKTDKATAHFPYWCGADKVGEQHLPQRQRLEATFAKCPGPVLMFLIKIWHT